MTNVRGLFCITALAFFLMSAAVAGARGGGSMLTIYVPPGLQVVFDLGPKPAQHSSLITADPTTGAVAIPDGLLDPDKSHTPVHVIECDDGTMYWIAEGRPDPCPGHHKREAVVWWKTGGEFHVSHTADGQLKITDENGASAVVSVAATSVGAPTTGGGAASPRFKPMPAWGPSVSGYAGASFVNDGSGNSNALPLIGGDFGINFRLRHGFDIEPFAGVRWAKSIEIQKFGGTGGTGSTSATVYAGTTSVPFGLRFGLPEFGGFRVSTEAGAVPTFTRQKVVEGVCTTPTTCTSTTFNIDNTLWGYTYGARVSYPICPPMSSRLRVFAGWNRDGALTKQSGTLRLDFTSNTAYGGLEYSWR